MSHTKHLLAGSYLMLAGMLCFAISGVFLKLIGDEATTSVALMFRFLFNLLFLVPFLIRNHVLILVTDQIWKTIFRGLLGLFALACMFYAIKHLPLADALLFNNTATLFVPLIVLFTSKQKTSWKIMISLVVGFLGIVFFLGPDEKIFKLASFVGLLSGFLAAVALVVTRELSKTSEPLQILFYYALTGFVVTLAISVFQLKFYSWQVFSYLCGVGLFGALYQIFLTYALRKAKVRFMSALTFMGFIYAAFFDWLIWSQVPSFWGFFGMFLVILGSFFTIYFGRKDNA